jgi:TPR repeat protein
MLARFGRHNRCRIAVALFLAVCGASPAAFASDLEDGIEAAKRGDHATALRLWLPLAENGDAFAQFNIGNLYNNGEGVPQDHAEAAKWYRLAADQGFEYAEFNMGVFYDRGRGVPQDPAEAAKWYLLAAKKGNVRAQNNLGQLYAHGRGVEKDTIKAARLYRLAADQGFPGAQMNLGNMYARGEGVARDPVQAFLWYSSAAASFPPQEKKPRDMVLANLGELVASMTPEQIAEARLALQTWRPGSDPPRCHSGHPSPRCKSRLPA